MTIADFIEQLKRLPLDATIGGIELNAVDFEGEIDWEYHREIGSLCIEPRDKKLFREAWEMGAASMREKIARIYDANAEWQMNQVNANMIRSIPLPPIPTKSS